MHSSIPPESLLSLKPECVFVGAPCISLALSSSRDSPFRDQMAIKPPIQPPATLSICSRRCESHSAQRLPPFRRCTCNVQSPWLEKSSLASPTQSCCGSGRGLWQKSRIRASSRVERNNDEEEIGRGSRGRSRRIFLPLPKTPWPAPEPQPLHLVKPFKNPFPDFWR